MAVVGARHDNINALWAVLIFEELSRWGVAHCCIAAGSRSAPLTMAAAAHPGMQIITHYDERGLGYLALGLARASHKPVAVLTTSGTAVANLYPAVIEAASSGVPLLVLSADRPPELLDCGANQAIDQQRLFGEYPRYFVNLPCPSEALPAAMLLTTLDQALAHCIGRDAGPVHVNIQLREPLYPTGRLADFSQYMSPLVRWRGNEQPYTDYLSGAGTPRLSAPETSRLRWFLDGEGLVIAGRIDRQEDARAVGRLATQLGWPLLADIQSQLRFTEHAVHYYDLLLNNPDFLHKLGKLDRVLQFGGRLTSKRLSSWLASRSFQEHWLVGESLRREDPLHRITRRLTQPIAGFCEQVFDVSRNRLTADNDRGSELMACNRQLEKALEHWLAAETGIGEIFVARAIVTLQPAAARIFAGNSLPVRLLDMFAARSEHALALYSNRGASGIDGVLATAAGCALGGKNPVTLLIGDLSLLHDLSSLGLVQRIRVPFIIVVLNNDGGGIFRLLPVPEEEGLLERFFQLPHGRTFAGACKMFELDYVCPQSKAHFVECYSAALKQPHATVIEVKVSSRQTVEMIKALCRRSSELDFPRNEQ